MSELPRVLTWLAAFVLLVFALALLSACTVAWTRLPDPKPGVMRWQVDVRVGTEVP